MWWVPIAVAAGQMGYNEFVEKPRMQDYNKRQAAAAAAQTQFSPWTGMGKGEADYKMPQSTIGAGLQGAMQGASFAQSYDAAQSQKSLADAQTQYLKSQSSSPWVNNSKLIGNSHLMAGGNMGYGA
jgi:hypothetical protein